MPSDRPKRPLRKKLLVSLVSGLVLLVVAELGARFVGWLVNGRNPYYLLYGFVSWTDDRGEGHSEKLDGYFKFPPNRTIRHGLPSDGRINNHGFRGPDFEAEKPPGTLRVACLGGSSTFGYHDPDDGTYPHYLAEILRQEPVGRPVEVLNLGIPHFNTNHIRALFEQEVLGYDPDVITIYSAYNDATYPVAESRFQVTTRWLDEHSAAFAGFRKVLNASAGPVVFGQWTGYRPKVDRAGVELQVRLHEEVHERNLRAILEQAKAAGIQVVLIRQPMSLWKIPSERGIDYPTYPTYQALCDAIDDRLEKEGWLYDFEVEIHVHRRLLEVQERLAKEYGLATVDNVALVDEQPEGLVTYVHLSPEANERLARAIAQVLRSKLQ